MSDKTKNNQEPVIDIINSNTLEYVFECLAKFNAGSDKIILRAYGGNLVIGVEVVRLLQKEVNISMHKSRLDTITINKTDIPFIEIILKAGSTKLDKNGDRENEDIVENFDNFDFINYSTYQLLFDSYLSEWGSLKILTRDQGKKAIPLLDIREDNGIRKYTLYRVDELAKRDEVKEDEVSNALLRSGFFIPDKWNEIGCRLSNFDDVILGIDTNIFFNCSISKHLLPVLSLVEPKEFVHTPNWILLVVPSTVMYELEEATNIRDERGLLVHKGRIGFRSLQEIMDLSENIGIPGVSLLIHGETNPILDIKNTLFGVRKDIRKFAWEAKHNTPYSARFFKKSSSGDMAIRYQFKKFLNQIDFHKGTFFLTADKSNSAMAQAEGLCPIYMPYMNLVTQSSSTFVPPRLPINKKEEENQLTIDVPIGNIIYEMAVSFGEIIISCGKLSPSIECDRRGDDIGRWVRRQLRIAKEDLTVLLKSYTGKFSLKKAANLHNTISSRFESVQWLSEMGGAFKPKE